MRLGTVLAVGLLLLAALNLVVIALLGRSGEARAPVLAVLAAAVAIVDMVVVLLLLRPWWPGRQERLARRAGRDGTP